VPSRSRCHCLSAQPEKASSLITASDDVICVAILGPNLNRSGLAPSSQPPALCIRDALVGQCGRPACARHSPQKFNFSAHTYVLVARIAWTLNQTSRGRHHVQRHPPDRAHPPPVPVCPRTFSPGDRERAPRGERACAPRPDSRANPSWSSEPGRRTVRAASRGHLDRVIEVLKAQDATQRRLPPQAPHRAPAACCYGWAEDVIFDRARQRHPQALIRNLHCFARCPARYPSSCSVSSPPASMAKATPTISTVLQRRRARTSS
jgi:hypothetical protein